MKTVGLIAACLVLSGCGTDDPPPPARADLIARANAPVICEGARECDVAWGRAIAWVSQTCRFRIAMHSEWLIETDRDRRPADWRLSCRVNRVPIDDRRARLDLAAWCNGVRVLGFGTCSPDELESRAAFHDAVMEVIERSRAPGPSDR